MRAYMSSHPRERHRAWEGEPEDAWEFAGQGAQSVVYEALVRQLYPEPAELLLKKRLLRFGLPPAVVEHSLPRALAALGSVRVAARRAATKTWLAGWTTSRRMHEARPLLPLGSKPSSKQAALL